MNREIIFPDYRFETCKVLKSSSWTIKSKWGKILPWRIKKIWYEHIKDYDLAMTLETNVKLKDKSGVWRLVGVTESYQSPVEENNSEEEMKEMLLKRFLYSIYSIITFYIPTDRDKASPDQRDEKERLHPYYPAS
jgi:hypothetical protein